MGTYVPNGAGSTAPSGDGPFASSSSTSGIDSGLFNSGGLSVFTGAPPSLHLSSRADEPTLNARSAKTSDLLQGLFRETPAQIKDLQTRLIAAGSTQVQVNGIADTATVNAYSQLLNYTALYQQANPSKATNFTPDQLLNSLAAANPGKGKTVTENTTSTNITDKITAAQTLRAAFTDKLGRRPTDDEVSAFTEALNNYEQQNPSNSASTVTTDASGLEKSRDTTTTGKSVDPSAYALQYLNDNHGPEQQAVNQLSWFNVALGALQGGNVQTGNTD